MSGNLNGFNADEHGEMNSFSALPPGEYVCIATNSEFKPTKNGDGQYLQFTMEVLDGQYKGQKIFERLNLVNKNQTAVDIAQRALAAMCRAVGIPRPNDSAELHNKPLMVTVDIEVDDRKRESNRVKGYSPVTGGMAAGGFTPAAAAPAQAAAASNAPAVAPWKKQA